MKVLFSLTIGIFYFTFPFLLSAQTPLTLQEAVGNALKNHFDIKIQEKNLESATLLNNSGEAGRLPNINFNASQNNNLNSVKPSNPFALSGTNISDDLRGSLDIQWTLFNGMRIGLTKEKLALLEKQANINLNTSIENTVQTVMNGYNKAYLEQEKYKVQSKILHYSRDKWLYAKTQFDMGVVSSYDILQQETNYLTDSIALMNQQITLNNAFRDLNLAMASEDINAKYQLSEKLQMPTTVAPLDSLMAKVEDNSAVKLRNMQQKIAENDILISKGALLPSVNFNTGMNGTNSWFTGDFPVSTDVKKRETRTGYTYGPYLNFTFSMPLFSGGKNQRAIQNNKLKLEIAKVETNKQKLTVKRDIAAAYDLFMSRKQILQLSEKNKMLSERNLSLSDERQKSGLISSFDYRIVQNNYLQATINEVQSQFLLLEAYIALQRLTGEFLK